MWVARRLRDFVTCQGLCESVPYTLCATRRRHCIYQSIYVHPWPFRQRMSSRPWHKRRRPVGVNAVPEVCVQARIVKVVDQYPNLRTTSVDGEWIGISMVIAPILVLRSRHRSIFQACLQSVVCRDTRRASIPDTDEESRNHGRPKV